MIKQDDYRKYGVIGTVIFHAILILLLIFLGLKSIPKEEEGLLVNFGDTETGLGAEEPRQGEPQTQPEVVEETTPPPPPPSSTAPAALSQASKESVDTQDFEEAAALEAEKKKKKEQEKVEQNRLKQEKLEADRKKAEEARKISDAKAAEAKLIADAKAAEAKKIADAKAAEAKRQAELDRQSAAAKNRVSGAFSGKGTGSNSSEGVTSGTGNQGSLTGDVNSTNRTGNGTGNSGTGSGSKGSGFSLAGRSLVGTLPKPTYTIQEEGIVVIEISVDKTGKVINATPILKGTTTQNSNLWKVAKEAALKAKFNADPNATSFQKGTITYHFVMD